MSGSQLYSWLKNRETEGDLESSGRFTIDRTRAWEKLGAFQLPFKQAWVLKIVQSAVSLSASKISVTQSREDTSFYIHGPITFHHQMVEEAVFNVEETSDRSLQHFSVAVRALAERKTWPFSITYPDGETWAWNGEAFEPLEAEKLSPAGALAITVAHFVFGQSRSVFSLSHSLASRQRASIARALQSYCHLAPVPIEVDHWPVNGTKRDRYFGVGNESRPIFLLTPPVEEELPPVKVPNPKEWLKPPFGPDPTVSVVGVAECVELPHRAAALGLVSLMLQKKRVSRTLSYHEPKKRPSRLIWLMDGVVVQTEELPFEQYVAFGAVVSADGLATDLTGFSIRSTASKRRRIQLALRCLARELEHKYRDLDSSEVKVRHAAGPALAGGLFGALVGVIKPVLGIPFLAGAGYQHFMNERRSAKLEEALLEGMKHLQRSVQRWVIKNRG